MYVELICGCSGVDRPYRVRSAVLVLVLTGRASQRFCKTRGEIRARSAIIDRLNHGGNGVAIDVRINVSSAIGLAAAASLAAIVPEMASKQSGPASTA